MRLFCLLWALLGSLLPLAQASAPNPATTGWLDSSHIRTIGHNSNNPLELLQLDDEQWQPISGRLASSLQQPLWLRIDLTAQPQHRWYLHLLNPHLAKIDLFVVRDQRLISQMSMGTQVPFSTRDVPHYFPIKQLNLADEQTLLLRLEQGQLARLPMRLISAEDHQQQLRKGDILNSLSYGYLLALVVLSGILMLLQPKALHLCFLALVSSIFISLLLLDGTAYEFLWPADIHIPAALIYQAVLLMLLCASWFCFYFFSSGRSQTFALSFSWSAWLALAILVTSPYMPLHWLMLCCVSFALGLLTWASLLSLHQLWHRQRNALVAVGFLCIWPGLLVYSTEVLGWHSLQERGIQYFKWSLLLGSTLQAIGMAWHVRTSSISEQKDILQSKMRSQFFAQISHEIRNPIQGILGLISILRTSDAKDQGPLLQAIVDAGTRLQQLMTDVLDQEKLNFGQVKLQLKPTSLKLTMQRIQQLNDSWRKDGVESVIDIDERLSDWLLVDAPRLSQVISNLLVNAYKFTDAGKVTLAIRVVADETPQQSLEFRITDQGPGISDAEQQQLFKPYSQTTLGQQQQASTGLGLYISQQLVQLMGGNIQIQSQPGQGACFVFQLRLQRCQAPSKYQAKAVKSLQCWVVEDNEVNQQVLAAYLRVDGHHVKLLDSVQSCLVLLEDQQPELILMDLNLTDGNGIDLCQRIREREGQLERSKAIIIGISGEQDSELLERWQQQGLNAQLSKPVHLQQLRECIAQEMADPADG